MKNNVKNTLLTHVDKPSNNDIMKKLQLKNYLPTLLPYTAGEDINILFRERIKGSTFNIPGSTS